jgi:quercetin dioxygenase-like cupin family protein
MLATTILWKELPVSRIARSTRHRVLPSLAVVAVIAVSSIAGILLSARAAARQDAAAVSPTVVKVKFANARVRVLETISHPGDHEGWHSHPANVVYVIAGGKLRITTPDGKSNDVEFKSGDTLYRDPAIHSAENIGTTTLHAILVELAPAAEGR